MKQCRICRKWKPESEFYFRYDRQKYSYKCKKCSNKQSKEWRQNHKLYYVKYGKEYRQKNKEKIAQYRQAHKKEIAQNKKEWHKIHRLEMNQYLNEYNKQKRQIDPKFKLNTNIVVAIYKSIKGNKNGRHWEGLIGYNAEELMQHLKKTLPEGYTWQDYLGGKLHIDHIIPIAKFNFTKPEHIDFRRCWALKNLRLLPAKENLSKKDRIYKPFQPNLKI